MNIRKITVALIVIGMLAYVGYRVYLAGGIDQFLQELRRGVTRQSPTPSPTASTSPTGTPVVRATPSSAAASVLATMNARRSDAGSGPLVINGILQREAQKHADDMAARGYFSHDSPDGVTFQQRMAASGYPSSVHGENIGLTTSGPPSDVVAIWMNSSAHRDNVLNAAFVAAGVGVANGTYQGQAATYVVAIFGDTR